MKEWAHRYQRGIGIAIFSVLTLAGIALFAPMDAQAQGGGAGGGGNGAACGGYCVTNGTGWRVFDPNGSGPRGNFGRGFTWSSPYTWSQVSSICRGYNVESVWIFVVDHDWDGSSVGWNYRSSVYTPSQYEGDISVAQAYDYYQEAVSLGIAGTSGLTWGNNIAWFCYTANPPWSINSSASADRSSAEPGDTITWRHQVVNNGPRSTNRTINWNPQNRGDWPNTALPGGSVASPAGTGLIVNATSNYTVQQSDYGRTLCRSTVASPVSNTNSGAVESGPACVTVMKKPKVHIKGGDLWVLGTQAGRNNVQTSVSTQDGLMYGSYAEYAIAARGTVTRMASGSGYVGGAGGALPCSVSYLTINNTTNGACTSAQGSYTPSRTLQTVATKYTPATASGTLNGGSTVNLTTGNLQGAYRTTGNINVTMSGMLSPSRWIVINAGNSDITITGDLRYNSNASFTNMQQIPQIILIARNIVIADNVGQVDAWLIATGTGTEGNLNTCGAGGVTTSTRPNGSQCTNLLTVNGPVVANHLILRRTAGAEAGSPAEIFNFRPDAYLWAMGRQSASGDTTTLRTSSVKEVSPRY